MNDILTRRGLGGIPKKPAAPSVDTAEYKDVRRRTKLDHETQADTIIRGKLADVAIEALQNPHMTALHVAHIHAALKEAVDYCRQVFGKDLTSKALANLGLQDFDK